MLAIMLLFVADPGLQTITVEGRPAETRIDLKFSGKPTFQAFRSHRPNLLVVDVVGAKLPVGIEKLIEVFGDTNLAFQEHVGARTQLLRIALNLPRAGKARATAYSDGIRLILPRGSAVARVHRAGDAPVRAGTPAAQERLRNALKKLTLADVERRKMVGTLSDREQELERMSARLRKANDEMGRLRVKLAERRAKKEKESAAVATVRREVNDLKASIDGTRKTQGKQQKTLAELAGDEAALRQETARLSKELGARQGEVERLLRSEEASRSRLKKLKSEKATLRAALSRAGVEAMAAEAELVTLERKWKVIDGLLAKVGGSVSTAEQRVAAVVSERKRLKAAIVAGQVRTSGLQRRLGELAGREKLLRRRIGKSQRQQRKEKRSLLRLSRLEAKRKNIVDGLVITLGTAEKSGEKAVKEIQLRRKILAKMNAKIELLTAKVAQLETAAKRLEKEGLTSQKTMQAKRRAGRSIAGRLAKTAKFVAGQRTAQALVTQRVAALTVELNRLKAALTEQRVARQAIEAKAVELARLEAGKKGELARLKKASVLAQAEGRAAQGRNAAGRARIAAIDAKARAQRKAKKPRKVLLAKLEPSSTAPPVPPSRRPVAEDATWDELKSGLGFGGDRRARPARFGRVGYRPVGPERLVLRFGAGGTPRLRRPHATKTTIFLPGLKGLRATMRRLDTSVFGGKIHAVQPERWKNGVRVTVFHRAGLRLRMVPVDAGLELRVP